MSKQLFKCGVTPDCPFEVVHLAGLEFPKVTEKVTGHGAETKRDAIRGVVHELTPEKVEAVRAAARNKVIRTTKGKRPRSLLLDARGSGKVIGGVPTRPYRPLPGDQRVEEFVYLEPVAVSDYEPAPIKTLASQRDEALGRAEDAKDLAALNEKRMKEAEKKNEALRKRLAELEAKLAESDKDSVDGEPQGDKPKGKPAKK